MAEVYAVNSGMLSIVWVPGTSVARGGVKNLFVKYEVATNLFKILHIYRVPYNPREQPAVVD